jgi:hypothetical protein
VNTENRYNRVLARKDGRRPQFLHELVTELHPDALVIRCYVLLPNGVTIESKWSEQSANAEREREAKALDKKTER